MQVDYESEEGEGSDDEEEVVEGSEQQVGSEKQPKDRPSNAPPSIPSESSSSQEKAGYMQDSMRVNEVLQISSSIEENQFL